MALLDHLDQAALGQHRIFHVQPGELVLARPGADRQVLDEPVVERPVRLELQGADRMGDALDRIRLAMGEVVGRIDAPGIAGARMAGMQDPVEHRVAQIDVAGAHVDLGAEHLGAVLERAGAHLPEQLQVLGHAAGPPGAVPARLGERAAVLADLGRRQVVDIGQAVPDQMLGPVVELLEIIRGEIQMRPPVEAEPAHVGLDRIDVFLLLLDRIGVVEAEVAATAKALGDAEVQADRLGMADMQIAVRLGREAGHDRADAAGLEVGPDDVADEIARLGNGGGIGDAHPRRCSMACGHASARATVCQNCCGAPSPPVAKLPQLSAIRRLPLPKCRRFGLDRQARPPPAGMAAAQHPGRSPSWPASRPCASPCSCSAPPASRPCRPRRSSPRPISGSPRSASAIWCCSWSILRASRSRTPRSSCARPATRSASARRSGPGTSRS